MNEQHRILKRNRAMKMAKIVHAPNGMYYDCRFADLNSRGGRVKFDKVELLGDRVEMLIVPEGVKVLGRVAWKNKTEFGVDFDRPLSWLEKHDVRMEGAPR
jgi:hypothetical protein|nr:hypothetical protein [Neorhizobium tomejilense]